MCTMGIENMDLNLTVSSPFDQDWRAASNLSVIMSLNMSEETGANTPRSLDAAQMLFIYTFPVILIIGTVGNTLCIVVLHRKAMQTNCSSIYLTGLAVVDTYVLWLSGFKTWIRLIFGFELLHVSDAVCRTLKYLFYSSTHLSAWLVVALTLERFVVVYFPFKTNKFLCSRRPDLVIVCITSAILLLNVNVITSTELRTSPSSFCMTYLTENIASVVFPRVNLLIYCLVPSITVFALNGAIIVIVLQNIGAVKHANEGENLNRTTRSGRLQYHQYRLTISLLTISVLWLLLTTPYSVVEQASSLKMSFVSNLARTICFLLMYTNHATTFYIYCITGRKFRNELSRACGFGRKVLKNSGGKPHTARSFQAGNFLMRSTHYSKNAAQLYS